jgi:hypothetical protein
MSKLSDEEKKKIIAELEAFGRKKPNPNVKIIDMDKYTDNVLVPVDPVAREKFLRSLKRNKKRR